MTPAVEAALHAQVKALEPLGLEELREVWRKGVWPAAQAALAGYPAAAAGLEAAGGGARRPGPRHPPGACAIAVGPGPPRADVRPGDRMVREWEGVRHEVVVVESGFVYAGQTYKSLSQAARAITGTRWKRAPRFFGLRRDQAG